MRNYRPAWSRRESWTLKVQVLEPWKYLCIGCCSTSCVSTKVPDPCLIKHKLENAEGGEWWGNHTRHIGKDVEKLFGQKIRVKDERRKGCMYVLLSRDSGNANRMTVQKSVTTRLLVWSSLGVVWAHQQGWVGCRLQHKPAQGKESGNEQFHFSLSYLRPDRGRWRKSAKNKDCQEYEAAQTTAQRHEVTEMKKGRDTQRIRVSGLGLYLLRPLEALSIDLPLPVFWLRNDRRSTVTIQDSVVFIGLVSALVY